MTEIRTDYSDIHFKENGKLKLLIIVGTRPEIIRLAAVINKCRKYFDVVLAHTGQNYDYNLNGIFFENLKIENPEVPEIIRLAAVINKCRKYFDVVLAHTGQNYDYNLNGIFFENLKIENPEVYMDAVGDDLGATVGNIEL